MPIRTARFYCLPRYRAGRFAAGCWEVRMRVLTLRVAGRFAARRWELTLRVRATATGCHEARCSVNAKHPGGVSAKHPAASVRSTLAFDPQIQLEQRDPPG